MSNQSLKTQKTILKVGNDEPLKFNLILNNAVPSPKLSLGCNFYSTWFVLNDVINKIYEMGSELFVHKYKNYSLTPSDLGTLKGIIEESKIEDFKLLISDDKDFLNLILDNFKITDWEFKSYADIPTTILPLIESQRISISKNINNCTHLYKPVTSNIFKLFFDISKKKNSCLRLPSIISPISFEIVRILNWIYDQLYIFRTNNQKLDDSFYVIGFGLDNKKLDLIQKHLPKSDIQMKNIKTKEYNQRSYIVTSILEDSFNETELRKAYKKLTVDTTNQISEILSKIIN